LLPGRKQPKNLITQAIKVGGSLDRLIGFNDETVLGAQIGFAPGKNGELSLSGAFANGGSIELKRGNGRLSVQTGNAGAALRFVDYYKRMIGGTLSADFQVAGESSFAGPISISNFTVFGEPRLAKLASGQAAGSASLAEATQAELAGEKASFELAQGEVVLDRGTIQLEKGILRGENVGATAQGIVLSATGQMDLRGTFMPARGLNRIVGAIPILGLLLGSGSKAGLIGITYQLAGDAKNPRVFVNPISMITPGVFRQIFE
jgi:AsmA-like C-terminal region